MKILKQLLQLLKKSPFLSSFLLLWSPFGHREVMAQPAHESIIIAYIDPLEKIMKEQSYFPDQTADAHVARGEYATFQFVFRNVNATTGLKVTVNPIQAGAVTITPTAYFVEYVQNGRSTPTPSRDRIPSPGGWYPDPLLPVTPKDLQPLDNQPVWISVNIPPTLTPGTYRTEVCFTGKSSGKKFRISKAITFKVYPICLGEQKLWVTNWWSSSPDRLKQLNRGKEVRRYSDTYWQIIHIFAEKMKTYRQNVILLSPLELTRFSKPADNYAFDFSNFDKTVKIFLETGGMQRIEGGHLGGRLGGWESQFGLQLPVINGDST